MHHFWIFVAQIEADHLQVEEIPDGAPDRLDAEEIAADVCPIYILSMIWPID